jgi:hypothetical protein
MCRFLKTLLSFKNPVRSFLLSYSRLVLPLASFGLTICTIFWLTNQRNFKGYQSEIVLNIDPNAVENIGFLNGLKDKTQDLSQPAIGKLSDPTHNQAILRFDEWLSDFTHLSCLENTGISSSSSDCLSHDPRLIRSSLVIGEKLSLQRKKVFSQIILNDPQMAVDLAIPSAIRNKLPHSISRNIETWQTALVFPDKMVAFPTNPGQKYKQLPGSGINPLKAQLLNHEKQKGVPENIPYEAVGISLDENFVSVIPLKNENIITANSYINPALENEAETVAISNLLASNITPIRQRRTLGNTVVTNSKQLEPVIFRKLLVVPARFNDETEDFFNKHGDLNWGTNNPLTNYLGEDINNEINADPFDLISRQDLENTMADVVEYYSRNTDQKVNLIPIISSTVTLSINRFASTLTAGDKTTFYDTDGNFTKIAEIDYWAAESWWDALMRGAKTLAARESEDFNMSGPAFVGIANLSQNVDIGTGVFQSKPFVIIEGGAHINPETLQPHPHFKAAEVEISLNHEGKIAGIKLLSPGEYYFDPNFGSELDPNNYENIFEWDYNEDPESPLNKYLDLCKFLDTDGNGTANKEAITPKVLINGDSQWSNEFDIRVSNIGLPYIVFANGIYGGYTSLSGSSGGWLKYQRNLEVPTHQAPEFAKLIGTNLGLNFAHRYISYGENSISDEGLKIKEGDEISLMGSRTVSLSAPADEEYNYTETTKLSVESYGDFTLPEKHFLAARFGANLSTDTDFFTRGSDLYSDILTTGTGDQSSAERNNTYRIYRSDFHTPPRSLREGNFTLHLPSDQNGGDGIEAKLMKEIIDEQSGSLKRLKTLIIGSGQDANATIFEMNGNLFLEISKGGRGFIDQPSITVLDENDTEVLTLNSAWIRAHIGINDYVQADLLDYSPNKRWARGLHTRTPAYADLNNSNEPTSIAPKGFGWPYRTVQLTDYYTSYRKDVSDIGVSLHMSSPDYAFIREKIYLTESEEEEEDMDDNLSEYFEKYPWFRRKTENFLLDASPQTQDLDRIIVLGSTYSDHSADCHITPIRRGGSDEMPWIEVVVHHGTVATGEAEDKFPEFTFSVSNKSPKTNEYIQFSAMVTDGQTSQYAYSWYINEQMLQDSSCLNQPSFYKMFSQPGKYIVRVVVSNMRGGVSSQNLEIVVDGEDLQNSSTVSGTVRSSQGSMQGARVLIETAPIIEHSVSVIGDLKHSFFPNGKEEPLRFQIDGKTSPDLMMRRGEIHRFNFDSSTRDYPMTFLEKPEKSPPRVRVNMLTDARPDTNKGGQYFRNPEITYKLNSGYASYLSRQVGDYLSMLSFLLIDRNKTVTDNNLPLLEDTNGTKLLLALQYLQESNQSIFDFNNSITRPYARSIMQESNISTGTVGPTFFDETGYITYGGRGYSFANIPEVKVRRASIWEDYNKSDAIASAKVDGVNTISPVTTEEFFGATWETRPQDPFIPNVKVWGTGGGSSDRYAEVNATVEAWTSAVGSTMRTINILNQGKGFEPNSTMAVLHFPTEPFAYWTFDRHESLFEDSNQAKYQPSPAWNREINDLLHYWTLDDNDSGVLSPPNEEAEQKLRLESNATFTQEHFQGFGLHGKSLRLNNAEIIASEFLESADQNFTLSLWVKPEGDFNISFLDSSGEGVIIDHHSSDQNYSIVGAPSDLVPRDLNSDYWVHLAIVNGDDKTKLYVNGSKQEENETHDLQNPDFTLSTASVVHVDELQIFGEALGEEAIRYLAGISFLDISGNKYHATPLGENSFLTRPAEGTDANMSGGDVPTDIIFPESKYGTGRLGDSFPGENHGKSLKLDDGKKQRLDLKMHKGEFGLAEGTISVWLKPNSITVAPIFSLGYPYTTIDNNGTQELISPGNVFSLELRDGYPHIAGFRTIDAEYKVLENEWTHLVASFPFVQFWINGQQVPAQIITSGNAQFEEATDTLDLSSNKNAFFTVGLSYDRTVPDELPETPTNAYYSGYMDDLAVYDRVLTSDEVGYLYDLRMGREQIPRLEAVVDAVGTIEIKENGKGYRENPDLTFWYGTEENKSDLLTFETKNQMEANFTENDEINGTHGQLVYVEQDDIVYSLYKLAPNDVNYTSRLGQENGWRPLISAKGLGEFENASLGDVVWAKRMDELVEVPMPDGRMRRQRFVDYVTMDQDYSIPLEVNGSTDMPYKFYQPKGLYGFKGLLEFNVSSPIDYNVEAIAENNAKAFSFFYLDHTSSDSISIVEAGEGITQFLSSKNVQVFGPGYQPEGIGGEEQEWDDAEIETYNEFYHDRVASVFGGFNHWYWEGEEDVHLFGTAFDEKISSITVEDAGIGYSTPCEVKILGGFPQRTNKKYGDDPLNPNPLLPAYARSITDGKSPNVRYNFREAQIVVSEIDANGSILNFDYIDRGEGYVPYRNIPKTPRNYSWPILNLLEIGGNHPHGGKGWVGEFLLPLNDVIQVNKEINELNMSYPIAVVTGGGGHGALFNAEIDPVDGSILQLYPVIDFYGNKMTGRGYFNYDPNNTPRASLDDSISQDTDENASLKVRLGGYLKEIPPCVACAKGEHSGEMTRYSHLEPWVEIWDRGRTESKIDELGVRAHGAPKVVNGQIKKIIVTNSGQGYVDPVAYVRDAPPKYHGFGDPITEEFRRKWVCSFMRQTKDGREEMCGHVHWSYYPPEECPGETDELLPYEDENGTKIYASKDDLTEWRDRHEEVDEIREHLYCTTSETHLSANFVSRKCWGTKFNYILHDEDGSQYRNPRSDWLGLDANLTVVTENGKIREIIVDNPDNNFNYFATQIVVQGTGSGVDAVPVFDENGINTEVIFDDPRLKNIEFDKIDRPHGAGQGFVERPWSWDGLKSSLDIDKEVSYHPGFSYPEKVLVWAHHSEVPYLQRFATMIPLVTDKQALKYRWDWNFGQPVLADHLGDRVLEIEVLDGGKFSNLDLSKSIPVTIDFNRTVVVNGQTNGVLDFDRDGVDTRRDAVANAHFSTFLTAFLLDDNATYEDNSTGEIIERGLFLEEPSVYILDGSVLKLEEYDEASLTRRKVGEPILLTPSETPNYAYSPLSYSEENQSEFIRINGFKEVWMNDAGTDKGKDKIVQYGPLKYDPEQDRSYIDLYVDDLFPNEFYYGFGKILADVDNTVFPKMGGRIVVSESLPGMNLAISEPLSKNTQISYTDKNGYYSLPNLEPGFYNLSVFMEDRKFQDSTFRPTDDLDSVSKMLYVPGFPELVLETDNYGYGISSLVWSEEARELSRTFNFDIIDKSQYEREEYDLEFRLSKTLEGIGKGFDPNGPTPELIFIPGPNNISTVTPNVKVEILVDGSLSLRIVDDPARSKYYPHDRFFVRYSSSLNGVDFIESFLYSESNMTIGAGSLGSGTVGNPHLVILPDDGNGTNFLEVPISRKSSVSGIEIIEGGSGYDKTDLISITSANGYGLEAIIDVNSTGGVVDINLTKNGFGYSLEDEINIASTNGQGAVLRPILGASNPFAMQAYVHDSNGSIIHDAHVDWEVSFDFNASEDNNSRVAELNATEGNYVALNLYSTLRRYHGSIKDIEILSSGSGYVEGDTISIISTEGYGFKAKVSQTNNGGITDINISENGFNYLEGDVIEINSSTGTSAALKPIFYDGYLTIEANSSVEDQPVSAAVNVRASLRDILTHKEQWLDKYLDSILEQNATWWQEDAMITVNLPSGYTGDLFYFCTNHPVMSKKFTIQQDIDAITVSGGQLTSPFYQFTDSEGQEINFDDFHLIAGKTYEFIASDINSSYPFKISNLDNNRTPTVQFISFPSGKDSLMDTGDKITVSIPSEYNGELFFYSGNNSAIIQEFQIQHDIQRFKVSGGESSNPFFYDFNASDDTAKNFDNFNLIAGKTYEFIASGINAGHPFMISDHNGSLSSSISSGGPLWGDKDMYDYDGDYLSNFTEWLKGSNPTKEDSDLDNLTDLQELYFQSNPIKMDTDNDGANDAVELSQDSNPRKSDSDGDGLLDGDDNSPLDATGVGVISGRVYLMDKYVVAGARPFYRFSETSKTSDWNATEGWLDPNSDGWRGGPTFFYENSLLYDKNYTIQVYLEINNTQENAQPYYNEGEPFIEHNVSLSNNQNEYGINLLPQDPIPQIQINPEFKTLQIDINSTRTTEVVPWNFEINATDPYQNSLWSMVPAPNVDDRGFIVEGNFTQYLKGLPESGYDFNSSMTIDLNLVPPGTYSLTYTAIDDFQNLSEPVEQTITIYDKQPPFLTIIDFNADTGINLGVTTENNGTFSDIYSDYTAIDFTFLDQNNASATLDWELGRALLINENLSVLARDNKSGVANWNVVYDSLDTISKPQELDLNFTTFDEADNVATLTLTLNIIDTQDPKVSITGQHIVNNSLTAYVGKGFVLEDEVTIVANDSYQGYQSDQILFAATPELFNDTNWSGLLESNTSEGKTLVLPVEENNYTITFSYTDDSNNTGFAYLDVNAIKPAWVISGKAIDGYLKGSDVRFIGTEEGPQAITDDEGNFSILFTEQELIAFGGEDREIDFDEGTIIISGGESVDTGLPFYGELRAVADSKIVSPLTSILAHMVDLDMKLDVAQDRLLIAFELDSEVNLSSFDHYAELGKNNPIAPAVLLANLRLANAMNISEYIISEIGGLEDGQSTFPFGKLSQSLLFQIAKMISEDSGDHDLQNMIEEALPIACNTLNLSAPLDTVEITLLTSIIENADPINLVDEQGGDINTTIIGGSQLLLKKILFDEVEGSLSFSDVFDLIPEPITVSDVTQVLEQETEAQLLSETQDRRANLFSPTGKDFETFFASEMFDHNCIWELETSDADGDTVYHSLLSGNGDFDGDGKEALLLKPDGKLCVQDFDDLRHIAGSTLNLEIMLDDLRGGTSVMKGQLFIKNLLALDSSPLENSWYHSDWLGSFYSGEGSWVYHHPIGWLYVHPDGHDGFWFWDHNWNYWWWSKNQAFPWIYRDDATRWDYLMILPDGVNVFDLQSRRWRRRE